MALEGRTALITGAGSGIGRAIALEASRRGMSLALVGRRAEPLEETRLSLGRNATCLVIAADVTSPAGRGLIRGRVASEWGRLDVLVNNAGLLAAGPLVQTEDAPLQRLMATNLLAPLAMIRDLLPLLRAASAARVVNIGSLLGDIAMPLFAAYSASKFGLRGLSDALRRELEPLGIGVTYAAPRGARTEATQAIARYVEPLEMPLDAPETIARQVWDAVARGKDTTYPRGRERLFLLVERLFPSVVDRALRARFEASGGRRLVEETASAAGAMAPEKRWRLSAAGDGRELTPMQRRDR